MNPILYTSTEASFTTLGLGPLSDTITCEVEENRNGSYELVMQYPVTGSHYSDLETRRIILAKPNFIDNPQPFRIYKIDKTMNGIATIYAQHVSYDLGDFAISPFTTTGIMPALTGLINNLIDSSDSRLNSVNLTSDISNTASKFTVDVPSSLRSWFGGREGSLIDVFGGEWSYDKWECYLHSSRGSNRGVTIRYGKNLTELEQEVKSSNVYTHMYGYWVADDGSIVASDMQQIANGANYVRILTHDFSGDYDTAPTKAQLNTLCQKYIANNNVSVPADNVTLDFVQLNKLQHRVDLCDTVTIEYMELGISVTAKCIRTKWDVLKDRYIECEFGDSRNSIADTIASNEDKLMDLQQATSIIETAITELTSEVANAKGFYTTTTTQADGSTILYMHDNPVMADSSIVAKITAETASWSTDGGSTWNAVIDAQGRGLFQHLYTVGIDGQYINASSITTSALAAQAVTAAKINVSDLFSQNITATNFNITGGSVKVSTSTEDKDVIDLNYTYSGGSKTRSTIQPNSISVTALNSSNVQTAKGVLNSSGVEFFSSAGTELYSYTRNGIYYNNNPVATPYSYGGSNGWTYRRWSTGWYECWYSTSASVAITSAWGSIYEGTIGYYTFPVTFSAAPHVIASISGQTAGYGAWLETVGKTETTSTPTYIACRATSATISVRLSIYAYGYVSS